MSDMEKIYARCFEIYDKKMFENNAIDFDDMLLLTVRILKENENIRLKLSNQFKYILVDEYQDTNMVQFEIIKLLTQYGQNKLTVVGDDDQSIYKFRGADIRNILEFENVFENAKVVKLTQNYRSTNNILNVANSVIKHNRGKAQSLLIMAVLMESIFPVVIRYDSLKYLSRGSNDPYTFTIKFLKIHICLRLLYRKISQKDGFAYFFCKKQLRSPHFLPDKRKDSVLHFILILCITFELFFKDRLLILYTLHNDRDICKHYDK